VTVTSANQLGAIRVQFTIPAGITVDPTAVTAGALFGGANDVVDANLANGVLDVVAVTAGTAQAPGVIFNIPFTAGNTAGTFTITPTQVEAIDPNQVALTQGTLGAGTITVSGVPVPGPTATVGSISGAAGATVNIPVNLTSATDVGGIRTRLCAAGGLTFTGVDFTGSIFTATDENDFNLSQNNTQVEVIQVSPQARTGPGLLFTVQAQIPANATQGQTFAIATCGDNPFQVLNPAGEFVTVAPNAVTAGVVTSTGGGPPPTATVSVRSANLVAGQPSTVILDLQNAADIGGMDITLQLANPAVATLVPNSGAPEEGAGNQAVVDVQDVGNGQIRVVVVSPNLIGSGRLASFQVTGAANLTPWSSSIVRITSAQAVGGDNTTIRPIGTRQFGDGILVAGRWVIAVGIMQSAPSISTVNGTELAFFGQEIGANGRVLAVRVDNGGTVFDSNALLAQGMGRIIRRPTVITENNAPFVYATSDNGGVAKLNATNGAIVWKVNLANGRIPTTIAASDGTNVYVGTQQGAVVKLNAATGAEVTATADLGGAITADPAANTTELWVGAGSHILNLNPADLTPRRDLALPAGVTVNSPPFISPNAIPAAGGALARLAIVGASDGNLYVFDSATGNTIGTYATGESIVAASFVEWPSGGRASAVVANTAGEVHLVPLDNLDLGQQNQTLTGRQIGDLTDAPNMAIISVGTPRFGYTTSPNSIVAARLPDAADGTLGAPIRIDTPYQAFAPAAGVGTDTLVVTLASGAVVALPLLPEGSTGGP
jgi:outer membrane protein assembly factor BamB